MRKASYGASLDPITNGHLFVIKVAASIFDELLVSIAVNANKSYLFSEHERFQMTKEAIDELGLKNIKLDVIFGSFLARHARKIGASFLVRGIRSASDLEYESG